MIIIEEFLLLIKEIPAILQYFLPGYRAIILFSFLTSRKIAGKMILVLSCLFSYLSISLISVFHQIDNILVLSGISFILSTVISIIMSILFSTKVLKRILVKWFHKTPHNDIWRDILDFDKGSNLKIYFKDSDIGLIGHHKVHEENGDNSWFAISAPIKFDVKTNEIIDDRNQNDEDFIITFKLNDVKQIEIF